MGDTTFYVLPQPLVMGEVINFTWWTAESPNLNTLMNTILSKDGYYVTSTVSFKVAYVFTKAELDDFIASHKLNK